MKRILVVGLIILALFLLSSDLFAQQTTVARSSGILNASAAVVARPARIIDLAVYTASADTTVICYDNATTNSGTIVAQATVLAASKNGGDPKPIPVMCDNGIYCALTGAGGTYIVYFDPQ